MNKIYNLEGKNQAIVVFKFFAALLITYSHMALLFPKYDFLVTGGAIGDGLFFFCSGFTLFLGRDGGFFNWYKRRISRIYPSIIMWAMLSAIVFRWQWSITDLITTPKYWFIPCIMVYYAIFYVIRRYFMIYMRLVFPICFFLVILLSFFFLDMSQSVMYAQVSFMRIYYFMFMLVGAITALDLKNNQDRQIFGKLKRIVLLKNGDISFFKSFALFLGNIIFYYICMGIYKMDTFYCKFQILSLIPLLLAIYYFFMVCSCQKVLSLLRKAWPGNIIYIISALTLEIYLVQYALFTNVLNSIFPLNILILYLIIFCMAYMLKCLAQLFASIFSNENFKFKKIFVL